MRIYLDLLSHEFFCEWGSFENAEVDERRPIRHLMLVQPHNIKRLLLCGPERNCAGEGIVSASSRDGRIFVHLDKGGNRWCWELFEADWWDSAECPIYVGRWPD